MPTNASTQTSRTWSRGSSGFWGRLTVTERGEDAFLVAAGGVRDQRLHLRVGARRATLHGPAEVPVVGAVGEVGLDPAAQLVERRPVGIGSGLGQHRLRALPDQLGEERSLGREVVVEQPA